MQFAVRALSLLLIVWLTAAASFPPCCWSMASAHDHQAPEQASASPDRQHQHHHHGSDVVAPSAEAPLISAIPAHICDTESVEALATPRTLLSFVGLLAERATSAGVVTAQTSATGGERPDSVPPGSSPGSAFLNPLRI
jgi:hypothetical protein